MANIVKRFVAEMLPFWLERKARREAARPPIAKAAGTEPEARPAQEPAAPAGATFTPSGTPGRLRRGPDADDHRWRASSM